MAEATIPVDLLNPGQVFACLGLMEAAELLCGPCLGGFQYRGRETRTLFRLSTAGDGDPVRAVLEFLVRAEAQAVAPARSDLRAKEAGVTTVIRSDDAYPCPEPDTPASLPARLAGPGGVTIPLEHWADVARSGRENMKFWGGAGGYSGAALARDTLTLIAGLGANRLPAVAADPFAFEAPQSSSFRFDWRRDYIPIDVGFSPNAHAAVTMAGFPLVELLAAIGLQNARPQPLDRLAYRYGACSAMLPTVFARAVLGARSPGFPIRLFRMRLGWPGQEGQARCIVDACEEFAP